MIELRSVKDAVVESRMKVVKVNDLYVKELERYSQSVNTALERVDFEPAPLGVSVVAVYDSLKNNYEALRINGSECCIEVGSIVKRTSAVKIRLLKALALEQLNANGAYSYVVAVIFRQLLESILKGVEPVWKKPVGYLENSCLYDELVSWVQREVEENE